jgi:hypothetical protein
MCVVAEKMVDLWILSHGKELILAIEVDRSVFEMSFVSVK